jgi:hypothetical protein
VKQHEYIIGDLEEIDRFAAAQGWRPCERAAWLRRDEAIMHYLHFPEQLAALQAGTILHVVGFSELAEMTDLLDSLEVVQHR